MGVLFLLRLLLYRLGRVATLPTPVPTVTAAVSSLVRLLMRVSGGTLLLALPHRRLLLSLSLLLRRRRGSRRRRLCMNGGVIGNGGGGGGDGGVVGLCDFRRERCVDFPVGFVVSAAVPMGGGGGGGGGSVVVGTLLLLPLQMTIIPVLFAIRRPRRSPRRPLLLQLNVRVLVLELPRVPIFSQLSLLSSSLFFFVFSVSLMLRVVLVVIARLMLVV